MSNINVNGCVSGTSDFSFAYNKEKGKNKYIIGVILDPLLAGFFVWEIDPKYSPVLFENRFNFFKACYIPVG